MPKPEPVKLWMRRDRETEQEYTLFQSYLELRSITDVTHAAFEPERYANARTYVDALSREHEWKKRTAAYDRWLASVRDNAVQENLIEEVRQSMSKRIDGMIDLYEKYVRAADDMLPDPDDPDPKKRKLSMSMVNLAAQTLRLIFELWHDLEASVPLDARQGEAADQAIAGANERLIAFIDKQKQANEPRVQ